MSHSKKLELYQSKSCGLHRQVFIDFDKLQTLNAAIRVQRLSFLTQGQAEEIGWYFRDDQLWREYGSQVRKLSTQMNQIPVSRCEHLLSSHLPQSSGMLTSSVSSREVERQFALNPLGSFKFTVGSTSYTLDFSGVTFLSNVSFISMYFFLSSHL